MCRQYKTVRCTLDCIVHENENLRKKVEKTCSLIESSSKNVKLAAIRKILEDRQKESLVHLCKDNGKILNIHPEIYDVCNKILANLT